jgi:hypothetical protein
MFAALVGRLPRQLLASQRVFSIGSVVPSSRLLSSGSSAAEVRENPFLPQPNGTRERRDARPPRREIPVDINSALHFRRRVMELFEKCVAIPSLCLTVCSRPGESHRCPVRALHLPARRPQGTVCVFLVCTLTIEAHRTRPAC